MSATTLHALAASAERQRRAQVREPKRAETSEDHQHWFEPIAEHLGSAYLRYSFTKGTVQEIDFVVEALRPDRRGTACSTSDAGRAGTRTSWPGAGFVVHGIDISQRFIDLADARRPAGCDVRAPRCSRRCRSTAEFDAAICLCEGAFGLMTADGENERRARRDRRGTEAGRHAGAVGVQQLLRGEVPRAAPSTLRPESATSARKFATSTAQPPRSTCGRRASPRVSCG